MQFSRNLLLLFFCVVATSGCGTEVVQTAERRAPPPVDCTAPTSSPSLPEVASPNEATTVVDSPLLSTTYGVDAGPGILIASRDAFRLYVNGELLAESTDALSPKFVGYSFLPGRNVIAVATAGAGRAPTLLVRIDELERTWISDTAWKVSSTAGAGWQGADYDDSSWSAASEYGLAQTTGSCAAVTGAFAPSGAHWIGGSDATARTLWFRSTLDILPNGFGRATTGGNGAPWVTVRDVAGFRDAASNDDEARVVLVPEGLLDFRLTGNDVPTQSTCPTACTTSSVTQYVVLTSDATCDSSLVTLTRNERKLRIRSNKTIVGLGRGAQLRGAWFDLSDSSNVILRNLALFDVNRGLIEAGDGLTLDATTRVWIDHCTFKWISDGFTDLNNRSTEVTFSWDRFDGQNDAACRGRHLRASEVIASEATYHHSLWQHVDGRAPFVHGDNTSVHLYNNVVVDALDYAVASGCMAQVLLEGSYFQGTEVATSVRDCAESKGLYGLMRATAGTNTYAAGSNNHMYKSLPAAEPDDPVFSPSYPYVLEPTSDIQGSVPLRAGAGSRWAMDLAP